MAGYERRIALFCVFCIVVVIFVTSSITGVQASGGGFNWKAAVYHFSIFFFLAFFLILSMVDKKGFLIIAFLITLAYAIIDELHQSFVPGRAATFHDVLINTLGIFTAFVLYGFVFRWNNLGVRS